MKISLSSRKTEQSLISVQALAATREDIPAMMRDPNKLTDILPLVESSLESIVLPG